MARFRLGLAGALILAFVAAWFQQARPSFAGMPPVALPAEDAGLETGRTPAGTAISVLPANVDDESDELNATRPPSALRAPHPAWWRIGPPGPDAALRRARARSTGPPAPLA